MSTKFTTDGSTWASLAAGPQGQPGPMGPMSRSRNRIINGDLSVNQREFVSWNFSNTSGYTVDQWFAQSSGGTASLYLYDAIATEYDDLPDCRRYLHIVTSSQTLASGYAKVLQRIEDVRTLSGKTVTVSFWAYRGSASMKVGVELSQYISSADGYVSHPVAAIPISAGAWTRYSATVTLEPMYPGMAISNSRLEVVFWTSAGANYATQASNIGLQNGWVEITGVQLEEGPYATTFAKRPYDYEIRACQRYFQKWRQPPLRGTLASTTFISRIGMVLPVPMLKAPTAYMSGPLSIYDGAASSTLTALGTNFCTAQVIEWNATAAAFSAAYRPCIVYQAGTNYLDLSAEIV